MMIIKMILLTNNRIGHLCGWFCIRIWIPYISDALFWLIKQVLCLLGWDSDVCAFFLITFLMFIAFKFVKASTTIKIIVFLYLKNEFLLRSFGLPLFDFKIGLFETITIILLDFLMKTASLVLLLTAQIKNQWISK